MFLKEISHAHQGCIDSIKKTVILCTNNNNNIVFVETMIYFQDFLMNTNKQQRTELNSIYLKQRYFNDIIHVFTAIFD